MSDKIFFHINVSSIENGKFILDDSESHHFIKVLRKNIDTEIWLTDGMGNVYQAAVDGINNKIVSGMIVQEYPMYGENKYKLNLGIGILKKDKMEYVVEKATECGVNQIFPIIMDRSIKRDVNIERLNKIVFTAVKQCGRSVLPTIHEPMSTNEFINSMNNKIMVFHELGNSIEKDKIINLNDEINILIGSEGDISECELELLRSHKAEFFNLGNRRLRSETAVVTALSQLNLIFN